MLDVRLSSALVLTSKEELIFLSHGDTCFILLVHLFFITFETEGVNTWEVILQRSHSLSFKFVYLSPSGVNF